MRNHCRWWWHRRFVFPFLLLIVLMFAGCAATLKSKFPNLETLSPFQIQSTVSDNFQKLHTFQGKARVVIELPGEGYNGFASIYIKMPDSIYVKTEAIFGIDIGALFLDQRYFAAFAPRENTLYYGERQRLDLRDFLQVEIETDELEEVFTGLLQMEINDSSTVDIEKKDILVITKFKDNVQKYWVDSRRGIVTRSELMDAAGHILIKKELQRLHARKGIYLPQTIKITRPRAKERITVYYTRQSLNKKIKPVKFRLRTPQNVKKRYWANQ